MRSDLKELVNATVEEMSQVAGNLLNRASEEDKVLIEQTLNLAAEASLRGVYGIDVNDDIKHIQATLSDIALKYEIRANVVVYDFTNRLMARAIGTLFAAL